MLRSVNLGAARRIQVASASRIPFGRAYASPSTPRSKPSVAAVEAHDYAPPAFMTMPRAEPEAHKFNPLPASPHLHKVPSILLPPPLPADARDGNQLNAELYRPTSALDTVSLLSICAARSEFVPRAYQIFQSLLLEVEKRTAVMPRTQVWANVIHGVAQLCKPATTIAGEKVTELWRFRTLNLIKMWEKMNDCEPGNAALDKEGILVYRAWFSALVKVNGQLDPIIPYIEDPRIGLDQMISGMSRDDVARALDQLKSYSAKHLLDWLDKQVVEVQGLERKKREVRESDIVPEVKPVLEKVKEKKRATASTPAAEIRGSTATDPHAMQARWTIDNLRSALAPINEEMTAYNRQYALEKSSYAAAEADLQRAAEQLASIGQQGEDMRLQRNVLQGHMHRWHVALTEQLVQQIRGLTDRVLAKDDGDDLVHKWSASREMKDKDLMVYLNVLPPKRLALITILEVMRMVGSGGIVDGMKALRGMIAVGRAVEMEHRADAIRSVAGADSAIWAKALDPVSNKPTRANIDKLWSKIGSEVEAQQLFEPGENATPQEALRSVWTPPWSQLAAMSVGSYLIKSLIQVSTVTRHATDPRTGEKHSETQPAFSHVYEYVRGKKLGVIKVNPEVAKRLGQDSVRQVIHPKHLPMLIEPRKWVRWDDGMYLDTNVEIMRFKDSIEQKNHIAAASEQGYLEPIFHGLEVLSGTPWRINRKVFDTVLEAWNSGVGIADIPAAPENCDYTLPEKPASAATDPGARAAYHERMKAVLLQQRKDHGERCKFNYNLEIARAYLNDVFYIPHNMDFRGRAYPIPPHLSPVGDDLCRGLLTFGISKPLGKTGLKWLQIHLANVYGFDKASFEERAQFARDHEADVFDSADNPLTGNRWWLQAEDPWQCLATCFELAAALRSPNPETFESSIPVHQDGTCNGMQHYAALGGDVRGAKAVNLERGDRPADIYTGVADLVNAAIEEDRKAGLPMALLIEGDLGRKVVKQTVMTTVYGVTFIGAREQIARQLVARGGIHAEDIYPVSAYVARKVLASIGDLFSGARAIQDWLTLCARLIARSIPASRLLQATEAVELPPGKGRTKANLAKMDEKTRRETTKARNLAKELMTAVAWTTPLGLPVVQPYRKGAKKQVMTSLQTVYITDPHQMTEVAPMKQATAFPPNYIHSLDATHMLLTASACNSSGITFASVHDSYWTHASTVEAMSEQIRKQFIHLHSDDLIGSLRKQFLEQYGDNAIPVSNARLIESAKERNEKRAAEGHPSRSPPVHGAKPKVDMMAAEADEAFEESDDGDIDEADGPSEVKENSPVLLSPEEIAEIGTYKGNDEVTVNGVKFIKLRALLPPAPPRGQFDVKRIQDSAYFFS
ncbi:DNA/RNA polymerase [Cutaneotrichosporon oleaginosum]|uniref:DNA-directed RNA polymerase n=1 Tax=Cutaneotrichosporon oleaginosum TaxID=879819 RepID=A0A0J0XYD0_9TREE|nr:DNA/RNA polymerase [Cutaneotrichosporon oleaginosum]KLT46055.1 DNA/RNA polymerase [Cutaneotrichosporon oleaginosum]TXT06748.1 hypothetical protein COLE_06079 [Cutaneotrichosporon oleaginosum]